MRLVALIMVTFSLMACHAGLEKFDTLVVKDEICTQMWSDYESTLVRRSELIPNLVAVAQGAANFEQQTLTAVTEARASATQIKLTAEDLTNPEKVAAFEKAQSNLKGSMARLMVASEAYPELKSSQLFHNLQISIEGSENRIHRARTEYNKAVSAFNIELKRVSGRAINPLTGDLFKPRVYFQADEASKVAPKVQFDNGMK